MKLMFMISMISARGCLIVSVVALVGSITSALELSSPCPGSFHYDSTDQPNQWSGTVTLLSDAELHGVWIRLIFDEKLTELDVPDNFQVKPYENTTEVLVKNKEFLLKAGTPTNVKITVKYEGDKIPTLIGYRLNAKTLCSLENSKFGQVYPGDLDNKDFLAHITSQQQPETSPYKEFEECGSVPLSRNQEKARNGQWPWQGAIYIQNNNSEKYICEATLITSKHVLTPAHCLTYQQSELVVPQRQLKVYLGKYSQLENMETQKLGVEKILLYPGYRSKGLLNDLAIIQMDRPVVINDYVRPICLKQQLTEKNDAILVGYGKNLDIGDEKVRIIKRDECLEKNTNLRGVLADNVICTTYSQESSECVGNSGSSMVSARDGPTPIWELKGIVIVGAALQNKSECDHSTAILILDVANYSKWIETVVIS